MTALVLSPSAAGLAEASWPPVTSAKRGVQVGATDSFLEICQREQCSFADLMKLNFELDVKSPALKGKLEKVINYYLHKHLGCTRLTPGGNYKFSGGETIYIPAAAKGPSVTIPEDEIFIEERLRPDEKSALRWSQEFDLQVVEKKFTTNAAVFVLKVTAKGKYSALSSDTDGKMSLGQGKVGAAISRKLTDDISLQAGSKMELKDFLPLNHRTIFQKLREKLEATLKVNLITTDQRDLVVSIEPGLQASSTPFLIKGTGQAEKKMDIGSYLGVASFPVAISVALQVSLSVGPSPALLRSFAGYGSVGSVGGVGVVLALPAFIALGIWDYGRRLANVDKVVALFHYVAGYEAAVFGQVPGYLGPDPGAADFRETQKLMTEGRSDAQIDAAATFGGLSVPPLAAYNTSLWLAAERDEQKARTLLRRILWKRLQERYPPLSPPISAYD